MSRENSARRLPIALLAAAVSTVAAVVTMSPAAASASTGITIQSGACSGGGSLFCYSPEAATATVGVPVTWTNQSGVAHTVTSCTTSACPGAPASTGSDTFNLSIGASNGSHASFTFTHAGTYVYYCAIHGYPLMHGKITVTAAAASPTPTNAPAATATPSPSASSGAGAPSSGAPDTGAGPGAGVIALIAVLGGALITGAALLLRRR